MRLGRGGRMGGGGDVGEPGRWRIDERGGGVHDGAGGGIDEGAGGGDDEAVRFKRIRVTNIQIDEGFGWEQQGFGRVRINEDEI
ncbi:hypothetical protein ACLOJK_012567 [Asimina triloba]